jgi:transcriptional regulator with XRE-family HTH domain
MEPSARDLQPNAGTPSEESEWRQWMGRVGRHARGLREFLGLSQQELAQRSGVSQGAISRLESGRGLATPFLVLVKVGSALAAALRTFDPDSLAEEVRRFLEFMEHFSPPPHLVRGRHGAASIDVERVEVARDAAFGHLIRLYHRVPERQRSAFLSMMDAFATGLAESVVPPS